jgi:tetratricopeptide (TPR) repeat protein
MLALAALLAFAPRAHATLGESAFEQGVKAYHGADYASARESWLAALKEPGADRAAVLYDLGNLAFREKKPLEAAGWYTASLRIAPRWDDAWHNLEFARREAGLEPADRGDVRATAMRLVSSLTLPESERLVLAMGGVLALAFAWEAWRGGRAARWACGAAAGALVLALVPWCYQLARSHAQEVFVTQPEGAALYSEPRAEAPVIGRLSPASEAGRVDQLPGWLRVKSPEGEVGWIAAASCVALTR